MKVTLFFNGIEYGSQQSEIIKEWLTNLIEDKSTENTSPLRYADVMWMDVEPCKHPVLISVAHGYTCKACKKFIESEV